MNKFKSFVEWNAFGVCSAIGNRMGIATSRIRLYFIYTSLSDDGLPDYYLPRAGFLEKYAELRARRRREIPGIICKDRTRS